MARCPAVITVDFETHGIEPRPLYPPRPVGVSIKRPGERKPAYHSWGHEPGDNSCTPEQGKKIVRSVWDEARSKGIPLLFMNGKFDIDVAETHLKVPELPWQLIHDVMYLLFLKDPHAKTLALKPAAEKWLLMPPEERDVVKDWLVAQGIVRKTQKDWGAHIWRAPAKIVGPYANGDVTRTENLFKMLWPMVQAEGMLPAYDRERQLMRILLENERRGVRVDMARLEQDLEKTWRPAMKKITAHITKQLDSPGINLDSNEELADALEAKGLASGFAVTPTGARSVSKDSLREAITDEKIFVALGYRSRLATCISMFMENWLRIGQANDGFIQPTWHQVRQDGRGGMSGARTGRLIATEPNLLNLSKTWEGRQDGYSHPKFIRGLPELPLVRTYMLPDENGVWCHRDYNSQELRILGHFEDGALMRSYEERPELDIHEFVREQIKLVTGREYLRSQTKTINFGKIYGMGLVVLAARLGISMEAAKALVAAHATVLPGLKELEKEIKDRGKSGQAVTTWGGRRYFAEEPQIIDGRTRTFEYKLLNYIIQGSAADATKEAIIRYHSAKNKGRFLVTVYDEINISAPEKWAAKEMKILRDVMESVEFDIPLLSEGKIGPNWAALKKFEEPAFDYKTTTWKRKN